MQNSKKMSCYHLWSERDLISKHLLGTVWSRVSKIAKVVPIKDELTPKGWTVGDYAELY